MLLKYVREPFLLECIAAAHAMMGNFDSAIKFQKKAISYIEASKVPQDFKDRLKLYESKKVYIDNDFPINTVSIGKKSSAGINLPAKFHFEQIDDETVFIMPRWNDFDGPISMRMTCLKDLKKDNYSKDNLVEFVKKANPGSKLIKFGDHIATSQKNSFTDKNKVKWSNTHYSILADRFLITCTIQVISGREKEIQVSELMEEITSMFKSIKRDMKN